MTNIREVLASNIKAYRDALGYTQAKLAEKADTSTHYIGMIETQNKFPSPEMLERIAIALGVDTVDLFSINNKQQKSLKTYRKTILKDVKGLMSEYINKKLTDID